MIKFAKVLLLATVIFGVAGVRPAFSYGPTDLRHLHPGASDRPPIGWVQFCSDNPAECVAPGNLAGPIIMNDTLWQRLDSVNRFFNQTIKSMTDLEQYGVVERWTYATTGKGDCEDYVLEKRRMLLEIGWPAASLLITVVLDKNGGGHAVLMVMTNQGEYVLDNMTDEILAWSASGLTIIKRQWPDDPNIWVGLGRILGTPEVVTSATRR